MTTAPMIAATAPKRAASAGMRVPNRSMAIAHVAETMPMVSLSCPCCSSASGTNGMPTPACRPIAAQAAKTGTSVRRGSAIAGLLGDTEMSLRAEGRRLLRFELAFGLRGGLLLAARHVGIEAVAGQQLGMPAALGDAAAVEHHDLVGVDDGGEPVRNHQGGAAAAHLFQRALDLLLGAGVERAGCLVEQEDVRVLEDGAGNRHPLLLATRQLQPALADHAVVALRQGHDEI